MSSAEDVALDADDVSSVQEVVARLEAVETELAEERERRQAAEERINELEAELASRAPVRWDSKNAREVTIEPDATVEDRSSSFGNGEVTFDIGEAMADAALSEVVDELHDRVTRIEQENVDVEDLVGITSDSEASLPIEDVIARCRSDVAEDPSANRQRAAVVFRAFGGRAESTQGGKMWLTSDQVESILTDPERGAMDSVNRRTRKAVMQMLAKLTSRRDDPETRRARDEENNLITLTKKENGKLALLADTSEWNGYMQDVEERMR